MDNLRKAPQRTIERVWKLGRYGAVQWHHELSCGHVETRKRKAPAATMGCTQCAEGTPPAPLDSPEDPITQMMLEEQRLRRVLSEKLGIQSTSISVAFDPISGAARGVTIRLDMNELQELLIR